jgi:hypothetical protein
MLYATVATGLIHISVTVHFSAYKKFKKKIKKYIFCASTSRHIVRGLQVGALHPLQTWMHPLGICKISKTDVLISSLKTHATPYGIHMLPLFNSPGWKQLSLKNVCVFKVIFAVL